MPPTPPTAPAFWKVKDIARRYQVNQKLIYDYIRRGQGPKAYRVGVKAIRIRPEDFEEWMQYEPKIKGA